MEYSFNCECKDTKDFCQKNLLIITYNGKLALLDEKHHKYDTVNNLVFIANKSQGQIITVDLNCSKIPELIEKLQQAYLDYQKVQEELKKQGKLELITQITNLT